MGEDLDRIIRLIQPVVESFGLELVDLEFAGQGRRGVLRLFIDREGGVTLKDCEDVSRQASVVLDVEDPIVHGYTLEVSSPGLDRPLKKIEDFLKFAGKQVKVKTKQPRDDQSVFEGRILEVREGTVRLETAPEQVLEIPYTEIAQARLVVETFRGR